MTTFDLLLNDLEALGHVDKFTLGCRLNGPGETREWYATAEYMAEGVTIEAIGVGMTRTKALRDLIRKLERYV